ncbi:MAG: YebC/PmpR family DNA-binding transcriptional regulator [Candidatus Izemoplasmataceae bacterium]
MGRKFEVRKASMMKTGLMKSKLYSRFGKEIYVTARNGGANPESNLALKHLIERAKKQQVPMDIIKRNIDKAEGAGGEEYHAIRYEGFGPSGSSFIVDTLTDNVNRTVSEVRNCFTKIGSKMGVSGSVEHMYNHLSYITVSGVDSEALLELLLEADIEIQDLEETTDGVEITGKGYDLDKIETVLSDVSEAKVVSSESGWYPMETITLTGEDLEKYHKFMDMINDLDDVQNVYDNVQVEDEDNE